MSPLLLRFFLYHKKQGSLDVICDCEYMWRIYLKFEWRVGIGSEACENKETLNVIQEC